MRIARFRVHGAKLDRAFRESATVTVARDAFPVIAVRPLRRRRMFALPLAVVAEMIVSRVVKADVFAARLAKAEQRKEKKGGARWRGKR